MSIFTSIAGIIFALTLIWVLGYILITIVDKRVFHPMQNQAAVALLLGLCASGILVLPLVNIFTDGPWFEFVIRYTIPIFVIIGIIGLIIRYRNNLMPSLLYRLTDIRSSSNLRRSIGEWASAVFLIIGAVIIVTTRPNPEATVELYGSRVGNDLRITVTSSSEQLQKFVLIARSASELALSPIILSPVDINTGPTTITIHAPKKARFDLYEATDNISTSQPIRSIEFAASEDTP
jgi:hypothetical protein